MTRPDPIDNLMLSADPVPPMPQGLAARIIAQVPQLPQVGPEPVAGMGEAVPLPLRPRRFAVPLALAGLTAVAASLAAVFLSSAQGWQGPALSPAADSSPVAALESVRTAPAAGPSAAPMPVPELAAAAGPPRQSAAPAIRPAATPVLAQMAAATSAAPVASRAAPQEMAIHADDAPIPQLSPAEAAAVDRRAERRAERRAARDGAEAVPGASPTPVGMGLRSGPMTQASATAEPR